MSHRSLGLFLAIAAVAVVLVGVLPSSAEARSKPLLGGWTPIKDLSDPHVKEIAEFAISEYNKQSKATLKLQKVISGETQVVSGINYRLVLAAENSAVSPAAASHYEATVWEKAWEHTKNLTSFKPVKA